MAQAHELVKTTAWKQGNLGGALADTYLRIDEILGGEESRAELTELAGGSGDGYTSPTPPLSIGPTAATRQPGHLTLSARSLAQSIKTGADGLRCAGKGACSGKRSCQSTCARR